MFNAESMLMPYIHEDNFYKMYYDLREICNKTFNYIHEDLNAK